MNQILHDNSVDDYEQLVVFELAGELHGVDIGAVNTIIRMQDVTEVPKAPEYVEGVINLRGSIIPVIDLRRRFGLQSGEVTKSSRIVVVEAGGQMIGVIVDAVVETLKLSSSAIEPPSPVVTSIESDYVRGIGKPDGRLVILLDVVKLLVGNELPSLADGELAA